MPDKPPDQGYPKYNPIQAQPSPTEPTKPMPAQPGQQYPPYPQEQQPYPYQQPNQYQPYPNVYPPPQQPQYPDQEQPPYNYSDQQYQQPPNQQYYDPRYQQPPNQQPYDPQYQQPFDPRYQQPYPPQYNPYEQSGKQGFDLGNINLNLDPNVAAALSYLFFAFSGIGLLLIEKKDQFVRFHALQSVLFTMSWVVIYFVWTILYLILSLLTAVVGFSGPLRAIGLVVNLLYLFFFGVWIALMVRAYRGERWKLPIIGDIAEKQLNPKIDN
jgi:uncharacterized membrane protein